jgi:hypothetical protein
MFSNSFHLAKLDPLLEKVRKLTSPFSSHSIFGEGLAPFGLLGALDYVFPSDNLCTVLLLVSSLPFQFATQ